MLILVINKCHYLECFLILQQVGDQGAMICCGITSQYGDLWDRQGKQHMPSMCIQNIKERQDCIIK